MILVNISQQKVNTWPISPNISKCTEFHQENEFSQDMIFWSTEGNIMSTLPNISKFTGFCEEWNFVQNMIFYSTENPFFEMVFSNMVGWVGEVKYQLF